MLTLGIDIGGTKVKFGIFQGNHLISINEIATPQKGVLPRLINDIEKLRSKQEVAGIGIASAGIVDYETGVITRASNLPSLEHQPLKVSLEERFKVPVVVDNDANCAALAEGEFGAAKLANDYICLTLGTGIGAGIVQNKAIVHGKNGYAGEVGHMTLIPEGELCGCGRKGCFEQYASGKALERMILANDYLSKHYFTPQQVFEKYDEIAQCKHVVDRFIDDLSTGLVNLQYVMDPDLVILGGGVTDSSEFWWEKLMEESRNKTRIPLNIKQAELKNNAGIIGANLLIDANLKDLREKDVLHKR